MRGMKPPRFYLSCLRNVLISRNDKKITGVCCLYEDCNPRTGGSENETLLGFVCYQGGNDLVGLV